MEIAKQESDELSNYEFAKYKDGNNELKKWLWVPCSKELYKPAYIIEENDKQVTVFSNIKESFKPTEVYKMNPSKFQKVEDLAYLSHLNEPSVLHNLKERYEDSKIYTYFGLFLIALNPYKQIYLNRISIEKSNSIYSDQVKKEIMEKKKDFYPHIFSIANDAYRNMLSNGENQSILITGESGAGKTENTKRVIEFMAFNNNTEIDKLLINANPVLEAFGNAKTIKNDNSSRFGKFIRLKFKGGNMCGAKIEKYLLEKSRVTYQNKDERSYHIFYYLIKGADKKLRETLFLSNNFMDYKCIKNSCHSINGVNDKEEFENLEKCFKSLGIDDTIKYYKIVAAILHLSNLEFEQVINKTNLSSEKIRIVNNDVIETVCNLLDLPINEFIKQIIHPSIKAGSEYVTHYRTCDEAKKIIEGLMKLLYDSLFDILIATINSILDKSTSDSFIGVLDIAGFEIFEKNSFEQLCINYTNEKLQQFFNHHMFILEQEIYKNECIDWNFIDFGLDLEPTISTIDSNNPIGILSYLDEECVMPCATDNTLLDKIYSIRGIERIHLNSSFKLKHYAGFVEYGVDGWLEKNKDIQSEALHYLIEDGLTKKFGIKSSKNISGNSAYKIQNEIKKGIFRTVSQSHRENLRRLMDLLRNTQSHFVRCILPNLNKSSNEFNKKLILEQLRCNGVLEGIRISRLGYPSRVAFNDFNKRYSIFLLDESNNHEITQIKENGMDIVSRNLTIKILGIINEKYRHASNLDYKVGKTLVFFRQGVLADFEDLREKKLCVYSRIVQALIRKKLIIRRENMERERNKSLSLLQDNFQKSCHFIRWKWWGLFLKIKPLLEVKKNENAIKDMEEKINEYKTVIDKFRNERSSFDTQILQLSNAIEDLTGANNMLKSINEEQADSLKTLKMENIDISSLLKNTINGFSEILAVKGATLENGIEGIKRQTVDHQKQYESFEIKLNSFIKFKDQQYSALKHDLNAATIKNNQLSNEIVELNEQAKLKNQEFIEKISSNDLSLNKLLNEKEDRIAKQKEEINHLKTKCAVFEEIKNKHDALNEDYSRISKSYENLQIDHKNKLKVAESALEIRQKEHDSEISSIKDNLQLLRMDHDVLLETSQNLNEELARMQNKCSNLESYNKKIKEDLENTQYENDKLQDEIRKKINNEKEQANQIQKLKQDYEYQKNKNLSLENNNNLLRSTNERLREEINGYVYKTQEDQANQQDGSSITILKEEIRALKSKLNDYKEKLINEENLNKILMADKDELYNENLRLMQSKLDELFKSETEFNKIKKQLQCEIQRLEKENAELSREIGEVKTSNSSDNGSDDYAYERINKLFDNEKAIRKKLDLKIIELENRNANNENIIRELEMNIKDQSELEKSLSEIQLSKKSAENELHKIYQDIDNLRKYINCITDTFQCEYFSILQDKDLSIAGYLDEIAKLSKMLSELEISKIEKQDLQEKSIQIKKEMENVMKTNNLLKNELDSLTINQESSILQINELKAHISKLEATYNEREDNVAKSYATCNKKIEDLDEIERLLNSRLTVVNNLIEFHLNSEEMTNNMIVSMEELIVKRYSKKIEDLNMEITKLNNMIDIKDMEMIKLQQLVQDAISYRTTVQGNEENGILRNSKKFEVVEKHNLVSSFVVDKDDFKAKQRKNLINCNCQYLEKIKIVEVSRENKEDVIKLENEINLLNLKISQLERAYKEQCELTESMKGLISLAKRKK